MVLPIASSFARAGEQSSPLQSASLDRCHYHQKSACIVSTTRASDETIYEAEIRQFHRYTPAYITVRPGTTIIWTNNDVAEHNVHVLQGDKNELSNDIISPLFFPKETTAITFNHEGDYRYFCDPHPYMQGYVYVNNTDEITRPPE